MKKPFLFIGMVVIAVGVLFTLSRVLQRGSSSPSASVNQANPPQNGGSGETKVADVQLTDYEGKTVHFSDFAGKPLVVNVWASWCPFCKQELPDFAAVQKEFGDKVDIIAIDRGESKDVAKQYSDTLGVGNNLVLLLDSSDAFYQSIGGFSMPETIFVDTKGDIRDHKRGPMDQNEMRQKIQTLLAQ